MKAAYRPMLATLVDKPFVEKGWLFENKWDGLRMIAALEGGSVTLYSRNGIDITQKYAAVVPALRRIRRRAVIDGELVALDTNRRSRFELLQNAFVQKAKLQYCVFDLLFLDGNDMRGKPIIERKAALKRILPKSALMRYSAHVVEDGVAAFAKAKRNGEEGVIGKRMAGLYYSGQRTREWLKIKTGHEQEAVIVGFTKPRRSRKHFGSLALAVYEHGKLAYVGHSGGGFSHQLLEDLHKKFLQLKTHKKPFLQKIKREAETTWVRPTLVCEVRFTEWTRNSEMRHPVFLGLRDDKPAKKVIRETPIV